MESPVRSTAFGPTRPGHPEDGEGPVVPLLRTEDAGSDLDALRTWQEALSDALALQGVPHSLFGLWVYPSGGEPVLIGPQALAQDRLLLPHAQPFVEPAALRVLEEILRDARYGSAVAVSVRHGGGDVALLLLGDLEANRYDDAARATLDRVVHAIGPMLGRVARRWPAAGMEQAEGEEGGAQPQAIAAESQRLHALVTGIGQAATGASTPRDFVLTLSFAIQPLLPHDLVEIVVPDSAAEQGYRLSGHGLGPLWSDPSLVLTREQTDLEHIFGEGGVIRVRNTATDGRRPFPSVLGEPPSTEPRSLLGVRLRILERTVGYLLVGNPGADYYQAEDAILLDQVGALIAPRVEGFVLSWQQQVLKSHLGVLRHIPMHLSQIAELLAATPLLGEGTKQFARLASQVLPLQHLEFAVRLGDEQRVAIVKPGDTVPLLDRPQTPLASTPAARVIRGELPYLLTETPSPAGPLSALVVPLRVAGVVYGALAMTSSGAEPLTRTDMAVAQQLADLIAPHFEVLRRTAIMPAPFVPGWKRTPKL
jgi:hypothetical protein